VFFFFGKLFLPKKKKTFICVSSCIFLYVHAQSKVVKIITYPVKCGMLFTFFGFVRCRIWKSAFSRNTFFFSEGQEREKQGHIIFFYHTMNIIKYKWLFFICIQFVNICVSLLDFFFRKPKFCVPLNSKNFSCRRLISQYREPKKCIFCMYSNVPTHSKNERIHIDLLFIIIPVCIR